jgi:DNA polymerase III delta subunit
VDEVSPRLVEEDVFRLVDAVGRRSAGRAVGILRALLGDQREEPGRVLGMLAQSVRLIWQTKLLTESGWGPNREADEETAALLPQDERKNALAQFARKHWLVRRTIGQAKAYSWDQLRQAMAALHACDLAMKGIQGKLSDEAAALELLVVQLCADLEMPVWESPGGERRVG